MPRRPLPKSGKVNGEALVDHGTAPVTPRYVPYIVAGCPSGWLSIWAGPAPEHFRNVFCLPLRTRMT